MSEAMAKALEEIRARRDFVVLYGVGSCGVRRTPRLSLLEAWDWFRIVTGQDPRGRYELVTACLGVMSHAMLRSEGAKLPN